MRFLYFVALLALVGCSEKGVDTVAGQRVTTLVREIGPVMGAYRCRFANGDEVELERPCPRVWLLGPR
jgi:hypothetical protein